MDRILRTVLDPDADFGVTGQILQQALPEEAAHLRQGQSLSGALDDAMMHDVEDIDDDDDDGDGHDQDYSHEENEQEVDGEDHRNDDNAQDSGGGGLSSRSSWSSSSAKAAPFASGRDCPNRITSLLYRDIAYGVAQRIRHTAFDPADPDVLKQRVCEDLVRTWISIMVENGVIVNPAVFDGSSLSLSSSELRPRSLTAVSSVPMGSPAASLHQSMEPAADTRTGPPSAERTTTTTTTSSSPFSNTSPRPAMPAARPHPISMLVRGSFGNRLRSTANAPGSTSPSPSPAAVPGSVSPGRRAQTTVGAGSVGQPRALSSEEANVTSPSGTATPLPQVDGAADEQLRKGKKLPAQRRPTTGNSTPTLSSANATASSSCSSSSSFTYALPGSPAAPASDALSPVSSGPPKQRKLTVKQISRILGVEELTPEQQELVEKNSEAHLDTVLDLMGLMYGLYPTDEYYQQALREMGSSADSAATRIPQRIPAAFAPSSSSSAAAGSVISDASGDTGRSDYRSKLANSRGVLPWFFHKFQKTDEEIAAAAARREEKLREDRERRKELQLLQEQKRRMEEMEAREQLLQHLSTPLVGSRFQLASLGIIPLEPLGALDESPSHLGLLLPSVLDSTAGPSPEAPTAPADDPYGLNDGIDISSMLQEPLYRLPVDHMIIAGKYRINCEDNWRLHLQNGIMHINGRDFVFRHLFGSLNWL